MSIEWRVGFCEHVRKYMISAIGSISAAQERMRSVLEPPALLFIMLVMADLESMFVMCRVQIVGK
jgi:hypothetical protein